MVSTSRPSMRMAYKHRAGTATISWIVFPSRPSCGWLASDKKADNLKDGLHKPAFHDNGLQASGRVRRQFHGLSSQAHLHVYGLHAPKRPTISRMVFTSPPSMRMACKQLAEFGDNFKDATPDAKVRFHPGSSAQQTPPCLLHLPMTNGIMSQRREEVHGHGG